ncbi:MAG TPA: hypothetical protein VFQ51_11525 [Vicinamibacteria bacterium]|nr:hypothetical protein [Vicinamibacteria bacterium]
MKRHAGVALWRSMAVASCGWVLAACGSPGPAEPNPSRTSGEIRLGAQTPASGATIVLEYDGATDAVVLQFSVVLRAGHAAGGSLKVEALDAAGRTCGYTFTRSADLPAGVAVPITSQGLSLRDPGTDAPCGLPLDVRSVRATLIGDEAGRPHLLSGTFAVRYRFVSRPVSAVPTAPEILSFDWDAQGPTGRHACPLADEYVDVYCHVQDGNGDALVVTIALENLGPGSFAGPSTATKSLPPSAYPGVLTTRVVMKSVTAIRATCRVEDATGRAAEAALTIPCPD